MSQNTPNEQSNLQKNLTEAEQSLSKMNVKFALKGGAFLSTIFYSLQKEVSTDIPTACTNGITIKVNPDFWLSLTEKEQLFLLAHEVMHIAFMHICRRGDRDPRLWNIAGDFVINNALIREFREADMPKGGLYDDKFLNMTTEEVYDVLEQNSLDYMPEDAFGEDVEENKESTADGTIQQLIESALQTASMMGEKDGIGLGSKNMQVMLRSIREPNVDWKSVLYDFVSVRCKESYSFSRRNRRYSSVYLPSLYSLGMGSIGIYIDVSGSVQESTIQRFLGAIQILQQDCSPEYIDIISFNTELGNQYRFTKNEPVPDVLDFGISGGTDVDCVYLDFLKKNYTCIVVFTDGCFYTPEYDTPNNLLWLIYDDSEHTFSRRMKGGRVVYVDK